MTEVHALLELWFQPSPFFLLIIFCMTSVINYFQIKISEQNPVALKHIIMFIIIKVHDLPFNHLILQVNMSGSFPD